MVNRITTQLKKNIFSYNHYMLIIANIDVTYTLTITEIAISKTKPSSSGGYIEYQTDLARFRSFV